MRNSYQFTAKHIMQISFNLEDIKFQIDKRTFLKAIDLYEKKE
ncbi:MAG: hypothetical protein N2482_00980 [Patescibacteria group bacterium]|nr:hypothetical protein [Patescibacteria group bacterium]